MSCYMVSDLQINVIVSWGNRLGVYIVDGHSKIDDPQVITQILKTENAKSLDYRYESKSKTDDEINFVSVSLPLNIAPVAMIKLCKNYVYQACEHPDFESSKAKQYIDALIAATIRKLPGYDALPWGIDDITDLNKCRM